MASTNQSPFYKKAEAKFLNAKTDEEKEGFLREMIKECPKHKSSEKMLANLKTRLKKHVQCLTLAIRAHRFFNSIYPFCLYFIRLFCI